MIEPMKSIDNSEQHFDDIASDYDYWKNLNLYYYQNLFKLYSSFIPKGSSVVEIGCGTGDVLAYLEPRTGLGLDVSDQMILIAQKKHADKPNIRFVREDIESSTKAFQAEYIFLADVMEHVDKLEVFIKALSTRVQSPTKVIISVANPRWEWLLMLSEKLKMKMPEGPHLRLSVKENQDIFKRAGFKIEEVGYRLLVPKKIPGSDRVNERFYKCKTLSKFGFVVYWVLGK